MRSVLILAAMFVGLVACSKEESPPPGPQQEDPGPELDRNTSENNSSGGLPPAACGATSPGSTVGCGMLDVRNGYCSDYSTSPILPGKCLAPLTTGTMTATIGGVSFDATRVGARRVSNEKLEVVGFTAPNETSSEPDEPGEALRLMIGGPGTGTGKCYSLAFTETRTGPVYMSWADIGSCTFEITDDGTTSGVVVGTFSGTIAAGTDSREVVSGTFSVTLSK